MNKNIIETYMHQVWNEKNLDVINDVFSETAIIHSPLGNFKTPQAMRDIVQKWVTAIPDIQVTFLNTVEENGLVVSLWSAKGTHQKELNGMQGTGKPLDYQGVTLYRLENGKIVEYWAYVDSLTLENQMKGK